jgi:hypothetical protein
MTNNRSNISSSADGADIFVVDNSNSPFSNYGNLSTSGDLASAVRVAGSGTTVINRGVLATSGDGSPVITVGDPFGTHYDNVTITNYGTLNASGGVFDDGIDFAFADGIDAYGNDERIVNFGTITATGGDTSGIGTVGLNSTILNYGRIDATAVGIVVDQINGDETGNLVTNYGTIHTTGDGSHAIWLLSEANTAINYGTIEADGFNGFGIALEAAGNHAQNYGTILVTGEIGRGVLLFGEGASFDNYGVVRATGDGAIGARFSSENPAGTDGGVVTNYGKIEGAARSISGVDSNDHVINHGLLVGDVSLGAGDDSYVAGKGGRLAGNLILGDGDDLIVFEKGGGKLSVTDFHSGAGSDDQIDVSGLGIHSLAELMSHATQSGADTVLKFGGKDQIVLHDVSIGSLSSDDFEFAASSDQLQPHIVHAEWILG